MTTLKENSGGERLPCEVGQHIRGCGAGAGAGAVGGSEAWGGSRQDPCRRPGGGAGCWAEWKLWDTSRVAAKRVPSTPSRGRPEE